MEEYRFNQTAKHYTFANKDRTGRAARVTPYTDLIKTFFKFKNAVLLWQTGK
jgi:hypothetical protein